MTEAIITALISACASVLVAFGTWHVSLKKDREKQTEEVKSMLVAHREEYLKGIRDVQDDVTQVNATVQTQIALIEQKIDTLSDRVDKHNNIVERMYHLEECDAVRQEQIRILAGNIDSMRRGA